jgi:hypothetical protein
MIRAGVVTRVNIVIRANIVTRTSVVTRVSIVTRAGIVIRTVLSFLDQYAAFVCMIELFRVTMQVVFITSCGLRPMKEKRGIIDLKYFVK